MGLIQVENVDMVNWLCVTRKKTIYGTESRAIVNWSLVLYN